MNPYIDIPHAYTFGDVTLIPLRSRAKSRRDPNLATTISRTITLKMPIVSSYMDTVTEEDMAIEMARLGGIGVLHRFCSIEREVEMIKAVKRKEDLMIRDPYSVRPDATLRELRVLMREKGVHSILVTDKNGGLKGLVQYRHTLFKKDGGMRVRDLMVPREKLLIVDEKEFAGLDYEATFKKADTVFEDDKIHKLIILVNDESVVRGLITFRNVKNWENPHTTRDRYGRLAVAAGVGIAGNYLDRTEAVLEAGADLVVVNVAHGHLEMCLKAVGEIRKHFPDCDLLAGSVATEDGAEDLFRAGVDSVLVGVGNGSICRTRDVTGVGVPQLTALLWAARAGRRWKRPIINDGGLAGSSDLVKAIAAGASAGIFGQMLAGTKESPSEVEFIGGKQVKRHRGMASIDAKRKLLAQEGYLDEEIEAELLAYYASEGVERGYVSYKPEGTKGVVRTLENGVRHAMTYLNALTIPELQKLGRRPERYFVRNTEAGIKEGHPHHLEFQQW